MTESKHPAVGMACGLAAYGLWGGVPLYFKAIAHVSPLEVLAHRVVWSVLLLFVVLAARSKLADLKAAFANRRTLAMLAFSTALIAVNWLIYIHAVATDQVSQASFGYFICPLFNVALGSLLLKETLRPLQRVAIGLAVFGVAFLTWRQGYLPTIALGVAISFSIYGVVRKIAPVDGSVGLCVETLLLAPFSVLAMLHWHSTGAAKFLAGDRSTDLLLLAAGAVTTIPLILFTEAARRLRLTTLGFLQYLAPTLQLMLAVLWFHEPFPRDRQIAFASIWSAIAVFCFDSLHNYLRDRQAVAMEPD